MPPIIELISIPSSIVYGLGKEPKKSNIKSNINITIDEEDSKKEEDNEE